MPMSSISERPDLPPEEVAARLLVTPSALDDLKLADAKTLICRCEDVALGDLKAWPDWREAKLQTRCGMGACQGRICGPITHDVLGWPMAAGRGLREPLQPAPMHCFLKEE